MFKDEDVMIAEGVKEGLSVDEVYVERVLPEKMKGNLDGVRRFSVVKEMLILIKTVVAVTR